MWLGQGEGARMWRKQGGTFPAWGCSYISSAHGNKVFVATIWPEASL